MSPTNKLLRVCADTQCQTDEIRTRLRVIQKSKITTCYRALIDGAEAAFVALDRWEEFIVVYELYVAREFRGRGIGSIVLKQIEHLAINEGFDKIRLCVRPIEDIGCQSKLKEWYKKQGYSAIRKVSDEMEKTLGTV